MSKTSAAPAQQQMSPVSISMSAAGLVMNREEKMYFMDPLPNASFCDLVTESARACRYYSVQLVGIVPAVLHFCLISLQIWLYIFTVQKIGCAREYKDALVRNPLLRAFPVDACFLRAVGVCLHPIRAGESGEVTEARGAQRRMLEFLAFAARGRVSPIISGSRCRKHYQKCPSNRTLLKTVYSRFFRSRKGLSGRRSRSPPRTRALAAVPTSSTTAARRCTLEIAHATCLVDLR